MQHKNNHFKRQHRILFDQLDNELIKRYLSKNEELLFASVKLSDSNCTLNQLAEDMSLLIQRFQRIAPISLFRV